MPAFTPAPWQTEEEGVWALNESGTNRFTLNLQPGFLRQGGDALRTPRAELRANARLIAASPDLYEALTQALASVEMPTGIGLGLGGLEFRYPPWVEAARAALRKADGL